MPDSKHAVDRFKGRLTLAMAQHVELMSGVRNNRRQASLETMLVEQFMMSTIVLWEAFVNDLILQYVTEEPKVFLKSLDGRIRNSVKDKFGPAASNRIWMSHPKSLSRASAQALIDPRGSNVTTSSAQALATRANDNLAASYARKFSLVSEDRNFIDFVFALRNYLGHRSNRARTSLKEAAANLDGTGVDGPLAKKITTVGAYLRQRIGGDTRAITIAKRFVAIAESLK